MPQFFWSVFRKVLPFISPQTSSCVFLNCLLDYRINYVSTRIVDFSHFWKCVWYIYICTSVFKHVFISLCVHVEARGQRQIYYTPLSCSTIFLRQPFLYLKFVFLTRLPDKASPGTGLCLPQNHICVPSHPALTWVLGN